MKAVGIAVVLMLLGCHEPLPIDDVLYACTEDAQCGDGWECKDRGHEEGKVCVKIGADVQEDTP